MCLVQLSGLREFPQGKEAEQACRDFQALIQSQHKGRKEVPAASHTSDSSALIKRIILHVSSGPQKLDMSPKLFNRSESQGDFTALPFPCTFFFNMCWKLIFIMSKLNFTCLFF